MGQLNIGGQALIEGIMMRNKAHYCIALKGKDDIIIKKGKLKSIIKTEKIRKLFFIRGIIYLIDSIIFGYKILDYSANSYCKNFLYDEEQKDKENSQLILNIFKIILCIIFYICIFIFIPTFIIFKLKNIIYNKEILFCIEAFIKMCILFLYVYIISLSKSIKRVLMYHGAEHKCINCLEAGLELNILNVRNSSRFHMRCGTNFIFIVLIINIIFGFFISINDIYLRIILKIFLLPIILGISYELIHFISKSKNKFLKFFLRLGLIFQRLSVKEPDDEMINVGITAINGLI